MRLEQEVEEEEEEGAVGGAGWIITHYTQKPSGRSPSPGARAWLRVAVLRSVAPRSSNLSFKCWRRIRGTAGLELAAQQRPSPTRGNMCLSWLTGPLLLGTLCAGKERVCVCVVCPVGERAAGCNISTLKQKRREGRAGLPDPQGPC